MVPGDGLLPSADERVAGRVCARLKHQEEIGLEGSLLVHRFVHTEVVVLHQTTLEHDLHLARLEGCDAVRLGSKHDQRASAVVVVDGCRCKQWPIIGGNLVVPRCIIVVLDQLKHAVVGVQASLKKIFYLFI